MEDRYPLNIEGEIHLRTETRSNCGISYYLRINARLGADGETLPGSASFEIPVSKQIYDHYAKKLSSAKPINSRLRIGGRLEVIAEERAPDIISAVK